MTMKIIINIITNLSKLKSTKDVVDAVNKDMNSFVLFPLDECYLYTLHDI